MDRLGRLYTKVFRWVRLHKISIVLLGITLYVIFWAAIWWYQHQYKPKQFKPILVSPNSQQIKVLILYSSGTPGAKVPHISENIDTITLPTSRAVNTAVVANMISEALEKEMLQVSLKKLEDIKKAQDVLFADAILIGSATHFSNMDWQTKRFFDETLYPLYIHHRSELKGKFIGCFTTAGNNYSGKKCIKALHRALYDYSSKEPPGLIILDRTLPNDVKKKVDRFTKKLLPEMRGK